MTTETIVVEIAGNMVRIHRTVEIAQMTGVTIIRCPFELTILMTISARDRSMCTEQRECGDCVTEGGRLPC